MKKLIGCKYAPITTVNDPLSMLGSIFWRWAEPDRFGLLNKYSPYNLTIREDGVLPTRIFPKETMEKLCLIKAEEIKAEYGNMPIVVLWSGGVDSTCILCSLLQVGVNPIILCTNESITEYPAFYEKLKNDGRKIELFSWLLGDKIYHRVYEKYGEVCYVIGWCADQLFGSNVNLRYPHLYNTNFKDGFKEILKDRRAGSELNAKEINNNLEIFDAYAKEINLPVEYTCEALWLFNFAVKWSHVSIDFKMTLPNDLYRKNVVNFFEDARFQDWSIANYKTFHEHNQTLDKANYKKPLKNVIFNYTKDEDYYLNKGKVNSWSSRSGKNFLQYTPFCILDEDGFHSFDLMANTEEARQHIQSVKRQETNRRLYLIDYLKEGVDIERFLSLEEW